MSLNKTSIDDIFICAYILIKTAAMLLFLLIYLSIAATMEYNAVECCYISAEKSEIPKALPNAELLFVIPEGIYYGSQL